MLNRFETDLQLLCLLKTNVGFLAVFRILFILSSFFSLIIDFEESINDHHFILYPFYLFGYIPPILFISHSDLFYIIVELLMLNMFCCGANMGEL